MQEMFKGPRLVAMCFALALTPPAFLIAHHFAPKDVSPDEAKGTLYVYSADR